MHYSTVPKINDFEGSLCTPFALFSHHGQTIRVYLFIVLLHE